MAAIFEWRVGLSDTISKKEILKYYPKPNLI